MWGAYYYVGCWWAWGVGAWSAEVYFLFSIIFSAEALMIRKRVWFSQYISYLNKDSPIAPPTLYYQLRL